MSAHIFQYIDNFWNYTEEEKEAERKANRNKKIDLDKKREFTIKEFTPDLMYGFWANIVGMNKSMVFIDFDIWKTNIPRQYAS